ncbi:MAG: glycosyltransferase [Rubellimicrobium sp.]|nr:glycosyltransferase [Rubellimicrobium sp.]
MDLPSIVKGVDGPDAPRERERALAVIIPAANEAARIGACLAALAASADPGVTVAVVVVANGCRDDTAGAARRAGAQVAARGWHFAVIERAEGGKPGALDAGDRAVTEATGAAGAAGAMRLYLDADVTVAPGLIADLVRVLSSQEAPAFAAGRVNITGAGAVARAYARFWARVPFMARGVPGCGAFAMNAAGRARWGDWPAVIADDLFARLNFAPAERHAVAAGYDWPVAEGFAALVRVRRRQDRGVAEIARLYPALMANEDKMPAGAAHVLRLALRDPVGFAVYAAVALGVRARRGNGDWSRGR